MPIQFSKETRRIKHYVWFVCNKKQQQQLSLSSIFVQFVAKRFRRAYVSTPLSLSIFFIYITRMDEALY